METFATVFEIVMVLCFGASWPFNIVRAYKARTTKGTSLQFTILIGIGYVGGILSKIFAWANSQQAGVAILGLIEDFGVCFLYHKSLHDFNGTRDLFPQ